MPKLIKLNFPEKLTHDDQMVLDSFQESLMSYAKFLEIFMGKEYVIILVASENIGINSSATVSFEMPAKRDAKKRFFRPIIVSKFLEKIQENGLSKLKIIEIRFELIETYSKKQGKLRDQGTDQLLTTRPARPVWNFSQIINKNETTRELRRAIAIYEKKNLLFDVWGLKAIKPQNSVLINLSGPPGTGKTMVAHAVANQVGLPIIELSYAQIESKYVGDGPKNIRRAFEIASKENALLFFDEADSLLGRRIRNVTEGADQAINSMRSQMIIELDRFRGVALFATNLILNYDDSFRSRLNTIYIPLPDKTLRAEILKLFLSSSNIPGANEIGPFEISSMSEETEGLSGRDLRDAFILAATEMALDDRISLKDALRQTLAEKNQNQIV
jgi:AAA+ superfamily predicted ATPase